MGSYTLDKNQLFSGRTKENGNISLTAPTNVRSASRKYVATIFFNRSKAVSFFYQWLVLRLIVIRYAVFPQNPLQRLDSGGMLFLNYTTKTAEINDSDR